MGVVKGHLSDISNPRLLAIVEKTLWFKFNIVHVPGKDNPAPDFMSRCKQDKQAGLALIYSDQECWNVVSPIIASVTQALNCDMNDQAVTFSWVERASKSDDEICNLRKFLLEDNGFNRMPEEMSQYNRYRDRLSVLGPCVRYA